MNKTIPLFALITCVSVGAQDAAPITVAIDQATAPVTVGPTADQSVQQANEVTNRAVEQANRVAGQAVQQASQVTQRALQQAQRAVELAQANVATADAGDASDAVDVQNLIETGTGFAFGTGERSSAQSLVVRTSEPEPGTVSRIQEDLSVMSRILTKTVEREVGREGHEAAMGIVLSTLPGARHPQNLYLEGYGALFFVNVKFPLVQPPAKDEEKAEKPTDTTWEQTKRELYGQRSATVRIYSGIYSVPSHDAALEYNAEQVEGLKKELVEALKNAANIRDIKPEESVTIAVIGGRASTRVKHVSRASGNVRKPEVHTVIADNRGPARESTMTIRVKKSDVDAFAKGSIDLDQFQKRVSVATY
jgi:hypothetical protein